MCHHERDEDQEVLRPLVGAERPHRRPQAIRAREDLDHLGRSARGAEDAVGRIDHDRTVRGSPDVEIGTGVPGVVEAAGAEPLHQHLGLAVARQVGGPVAREHLREDPDVVGDRRDHLHVGGGGEDDPPAGRPLRSEVGEQLLTIRQRLGTDAHPPRDHPLESRLSPQEPERHDEQRPGPLPHETDDRLPQQIGRQQRAVEIDAEHARGAPLWHARSGVCGRARGRVHHDRANVWRSSLPVEVLGSSAMISMCSGTM